MFSYHPDTRNIGDSRCYRAGFRVADVEDVHRIARGMTHYVWSPIEWADGRRHESCFLGASWCALDFDDGTMTLSEATENHFADSIHVIGTTKSHRVPKSGKPACDRFRVLLRFATRIENIEDYKATMRRYLSHYDADKKCHDGARFFWPCAEIVSVQDDGYTQEAFLAEVGSIDHPETQELRRDMRRWGYERTRTLPPWIRAFVESGRLIRDGGRNSTIYAVAIELFRLGFKEAEIDEMIDRAPIDRADFDYAKEVASCLKSAKRGAKSLGRSQMPTGGRS